MLFQTLDSKNECVGIYSQGKIIHDTIPSNLTRTWGYAPYLQGRDIEYASLYALGDNLEDCCPEEMREEYLRVRNKLKAYFRSFVESKVDLNKLCFFDLVPERFLREYCEIKNNITDYVLKNYPKPENYDFLVSLSKVANNIRYSKVNIDNRALSSMSTSPKGKAFYKKLSKTNPYVSYNIFGTITGRLTTHRNSFPILTFPKEFRHIIKPNNDYFLELDFNAAEIRTLLALAGHDQPEEDIHSWIAKNVFEGSVSREESKIKTFAWLYNPEAQNSKLEKIFDREKIYDLYWKEGVVHTPFGRKIKADHKHALNYLIQSTTSDIFLRQMIKVSSIIENKKSYISFCIHDSLIIDLAKEDTSLVEDIKNIFSKTQFGQIKSNIEIGKHFGGMKKLEF